MSNETPNPNQYPLGEPSVLDYVKSLFRFGNGDRIHIPEFIEEEQEEKPFAMSDQYTATDFQVAEAQPQVIIAAEPEPLQPSTAPTGFPWHSLLAFFLALIGQRLFEP